MPEKKLLTLRCGAIEPSDLKAYQGMGGFKASAKAFDKMTPEQVIEQVKSSDLRGRGGAGFNCGAKWEMAGKASGKVKYLICNADEGEVGTFKDRYIIQNDPFSLIEGMAIAAYAIGASRAFIYLRAEYRFLRERLEAAVKSAQNADLIGGLKIEIREGAGAYICGEESALMNSIEGLRGESRYRPPFPTTSGLFGKPTIINNVETLVNIPLIIQKGAKWYSKLGTAQSKGTKLFCVSGDAARPGVYELELGSSLRELVEDLAGARDIKMVQVGGSTGKVIPAEDLDMPLAYETALGSGAVVVLGKDRDVIDFARVTIEFLAEESCGQCTPCREGLEVLRDILNRLARGEGASDDLNAMEDICRVMAISSLCGLGQAAPTPVLDTLKYFRDQYEDRIDQAVFLRSLKAVSA